jgi:CHASE2 domain-containing sensor protein/signal transduction histidine kinase
MTSARLMLEWAILLICAIAGASFLNASGIAGRVDNQLLDHAAAMTRPAAHPDVVLVTIDDRSLAQQGAWPWPRSIHAQLIDRLNEAGARLVVLDVLFLESTDPLEDEALATALRSNGRVILPHTFAPRPNTEAQEEPLLPLPELASAAQAVGHAVAMPDPDGVLRRFDLGLELDGTVYPHLALAAVKALDDPGAPGLVDTVPVIAFQPHASFPELSASSVIAGAAPAGFLRDKIVLIGATAQGMGDRYSVASGDVALMSGVEAQANVISAILQDGLIQPVARLWHDALAAVTLLLLFLAFWHLSPRYVLICALGLIGALLLLSLSLLAGVRLWLAPASITIAIMLAYPLWSWRRLSHASRYLDREAARLTGESVVRGEVSGLDYVTHQIEKLRGLITNVHDSLGFLRRVIETAPDAIIVLDRDERVQMLNARATALFPDWEALESVSLGEFLLFAQARLVRDGSEMETVDGRTFLIARAEFDGADKSGAAGSIIALREVTEVRRLDEERRQMLEFLSHDMRTPQVAIVGLTRQAGAVDGSMDVDTLRRIRQQAERTLKLADDFVQLARLEHPELQIEEADVAALAQEACDRAYTLAQARQITLAQEIPDEPCFAMVDASLIARMLDNLIGNAIKYSPEGSRVLIRLVTEGDDRLSLTIADNGPGLPEARQVDPFARFGAYSPGGGTNAGPSVGLGLALVKKVVDAHNASIAVRSSTGAGTTFEIAL